MLILLENIHVYAPLIANIRDLLQIDWEVSIHHTLREGNNSANFLAKLGSGMEEFLRLWEEPPIGLASLLLADAMRVQLLQP